MAVHERDAGHQVKFHGNSKKGWEMDYAMGAGCESEITGADEIFFKTRVNKPGNWFGLISRHKKSL
jgi:hypothetical protein